MYCLHLIRARISNRRVAFFAVKYKNHSKLNKNLFITSQEGLDMIINKLRASTKRASGLIHELNRERVSRRLFELNAATPMNSLASNITPSLTKATASASVSATTATTASAASTNAAIKSKLPPFSAGDAVVVSYYSSLASKKKEVFRGVVLGKRNRGYGSSFKVIASIGNTQVEQTFPLYSPLIDSIEVIREKHIHDGKKRVRRSKVFYIRERPQSTFRIKAGDNAQTLSGVDVNKRKKKGKSNTKSDIKQSTASTTTNATAATSQQQQPAAKQ